MNKHKRIFIVGHMGAGKALLGQALADKLGWHFVDANLGLERHIGRALPDILGKQGEEAFHQCEAEILAHYIGDENIVITTDDGVFLSEKNRKLLASEFVIYLKVTTPEQIKRMSDDAYPLLPIADRSAFLDKLHQERDELFEKAATLTIDSQSIEDDVIEIMRAFEAI